MGTIGGVRVKCGTCGAAIYETTKHYDPRVRLTGDMLTLCEPYRSSNWPTYDGSLQGPGTSWYRMWCTRCAGLVAPTGKVRFVDVGDIGPPATSITVPESPKLVLEKEIVHIKPNNKRKKG